MKHNILPNDRWILCPTHFTCRSLLCLKMEKHVGCDGGQKCFKNSYLYKEWQYNVVFELFITFGEPSFKETKVNFHREDPLC